MRQRIGTVQGTPLFFERDWRYADMSRTEEQRRILLDKANDLPLCAGVYLMRDRTGKVIYVGKSRKLKNRVSQYFQNNEKAA